MRLCPGPPVPIVLLHGSSHAGRCKDGGDRGGLHRSPAHPGPGSHEPHGSLPAQHHSPVCPGESGTGGQEICPQTLLRGLGCVARRSLGLCRRADTWLSKLRSERGGHKSLLEMQPRRREEHLHVQDNTKGTNVEHGSEPSARRSSLTLGPSRAVCAESTSGSQVAHKQTGSAQEFTEMKFSSQ